MYEKTLQMRCSDNCYQSAKATQELAAAFFDYLKSEGSIDIPIGAILGDSDGGMSDSNEWSERNISPGADMLSSSPGSF